MVLTKGQHFKKHIQKARDMRKSQAHISGTSNREVEIQGTEISGRKLQQQRANAFSNCPSQRFIYPGTTMDSIFDQLSIQEFQSAAQAVVSSWIQVCAHFLLESINLILMWHQYGYVSPKGCCDCVASESSCNWMKEAQHCDWASRLLTSYCANVQLKKQNALRLSLWYLGHQDRERSRKIHRCNRLCFSV